jgi:heme-degrading monooxygenase HmoA
MVTEMAFLQVRKNQTDQFERAFFKAQKILSSMQGYRGHELQRGIERDDTYVLIVRWNTLEDHTVGFRGSPQYIEWKNLLHHFYDPFPQVEHFKKIY